MSNKSPILLLDIDENGNFLINKQAIYFLQSLKKKLAILSIVGPYRSGKSYILNRFAGKQQGFQIGSSTNPCTKGIWIWGEPIPLTEQIDLILLDTEGLNSYKRDEQIDAKLFLITNLLSSTLIYNVFHNIDERALEQLSFITSISSLFLDQEKNQISQQFPNLIWLVRDFSLNLTNKQNQTLTSKQYMENQLRLAEGQTEEIQQKNQVRMAILNYYNQRDCHTLVRPVIEEEKLRNIEKLQYSELRSTFKNEVQILIQKTMQYIKPKIVNNSAVNGQIFAQLIIQYVEGINSQRMPQITSLQERVIIKEYNRILQAAKEYFNELIEQEILQKMPLNESEINEIFQQISEKSKQVLDKFTYSQELYTEGLVQLNNFSLEKINKINQKNYQSSKNYSTLIANKLLEALEKKIDKGQIENFVQFRVEFSNYKKIYQKESKGPANFEIFTNTFVDGSFNLLDRLLVNSKIQNEKQYVELEKQIIRLQGQLEQEKLIFQREKRSLHEQYLQEKEKNEEYLNFQSEKFIEMKNTYQQQLESLQKWQIDQSQETDSLKQLIKQNFGLQNNHNNNKNIQYGNQQSPYFNEDAQTEFLDLRQTIQELQTFVSELKQQVLNLKIEKQEILTSSAIEKIKLESQKELKQEIEKEQIEFEKAKKKITNTAKVTDRSKGGPGQKIRKYEFVTIGKRRTNQSIKGKNIQL